MYSKHYLEMICIAAFALQLAVCFLVKRRWLRCLPVILLAVLAGVCLICYACSGFTNWAWLIILALVSMVLLAAGVAWLVYGIFRLIKKYAKKIEV